MRVMPTLSSRMPAKGGKNEQEGFLISVGHRAFVRIFFN